MTPSRRAILAASALAGVAPMARAQGPGLGGALYDLVARYSARPHHRTGTPEAAATLDWMAAELTARGGAVERRPYAFERYEHRGSVSIDGRRVESLPLYYEGVGEIASEAPFLRPVALANNFDKSDLAAALREAAASGASAAVFATFGRFGAEPPRPNLIAVNVDPDKPVSGIPTLLVSGDHLDALAGGSVFAGLSARRVPDRADNLVARLGPAGDRPVVVTTPLTGWFACAAERGTGVAIALELARELARTVPVVVVATTGHELDNLGLRRLLTDGLDLKPRAVVHLGACVAAGIIGAGGLVRPAPLRLASANRPLDAESPLGRILRPAGFAAPPRFLGEGEVWSRHLGDATPLLSFSGAFPLFHTPGDVAVATTSPALLEAACRAVTEAAAVLVG